MCMEKLGKVVKISKPRRVWKIVRVNAHGFYGPFTEYKYKTGLNRTHGYMLTCNCVFYNECFGCFPTLKDAKGSMAWYYVDILNDAFIIPCTIPAGTTIQHGEYEGSYDNYRTNVRCITTPYLEFPDYHPYYNKMLVKINKEN